MVHQVLSVITFGGIQKNDLVSSPGNDLLTLFYLGMFFVQLCGKDHMINACDFEKLICIFVFSLLNHTKIALLMYCKTFPKQTFLSDKKKPNPHILSTSESLKQKLCITIRFIATS